MSNSLATPASITLSKMREMGDVITPRSAHEVPQGGHFVYLVFNGENVLQLGKGNTDRVRKCSRGGLAGKHNKAFVCAIGELVLGSPNQYAMVNVGAQKAEGAEAMLHRAIGIETNQTGATLIAGIDETSIRGVHEALWERAKKTVAYQALDEVEQMMAEEMFEIVTYATSSVQRTSRVVESKQADNLEGNILMRIGRRYIANILVTLTDGYLRYGKHLMTDAEFTSAKSGYMYSPVGRPFVVSG